MTTCSGTTFASLDGLKESPPIFGQEVFAGFPCADLYSSFSTADVGKPQTNGLLIERFAAKFQSPSSTCF